jgi:hypothetical protein
MAWREVAEAWGGMTQDAVCGNVVGSCSRDNDDNDVM